MSTVTHKEGNSTHSPIINAKGEDGADTMEDYKTQSECENLRRLCTQKLQRFVTSSELFTERDLKAYEDILTDSKLTLAGKVTYAQKKEALEENISEFIPRTMENISRAEDVFYGMLATAHSRDTITHETAMYWHDKIKSKKIPWWEKEKFIYEKFPHMVANWETLTRDIEKVKNSVKQNRMFADIPAVKNVIGEKTSLKKYKDWRNAVSEALGAIEAEKRLQQNLFRKAKTILESAASSKVLSSKKVGMWLHRIFKSNASNDKIEKFVSGSGASSLSGMINRWSSVQNRFDKIENERKKGDEPRGFHFVTTDKFLDWHYTKRLAYVGEAEKRFVNVATENPILLAIRRELDSQDWESAAIIIKQAESEPLSEKDKIKLSSMKWYLREYQSENPVEKTDDPQTKEDYKEELDHLISALPTVLQPLYKKAINAGKFYCLSAIMYNRVWCREKGQVLTGHKEVVLNESSEEDTKRVLENGDDGRLRNAAVSAYREPSIRGYANTGINAPQILHLGSGGQDALVAKMMTDDNERFRYWTTLIPEGVDYGTHSYVVKKLNPQIKKCLRNIESSSAPTIRKKSSSKSSTIPKYSQVS
ncbi:hypothetical protein KKF55_05040 [Patescibacteria group bacterium]|nr:hypothetical protein [Patescibacteria group bacterium]